MIPGPDVIGSIESQLNSLRTRAVRRQGFVEMMRNARSNESSSDESGDSGEQSNSEQVSDRGNTAETRVNV